MTDFQGAGNNPVLRPAGQLDPATGVSPELMFQMIDPESPFAETQMTGSQLNGTDGYNAMLLPQGGYLQADTATTSATSATAPAAQLYPQSMQLAYNLGQVDGFTQLLSTPLTGQTEPVVSGQPGGTIVPVNTTVPLEVSQPNAPTVTVPTVTNPASAEIPPQVTGGPVASGTIPATVSVPNTTSTTTDTHEVAEDTTGIPEDQLPEASKNSDSPQSEALSATSNMRDNIEKVRQDKKDHKNGIIGGTFDRAKGVLGTRNSSKEINKYFGEVDDEIARMDDAAQEGDLEDVSDSYEKLTGLKYTPGQVYSTPEELAEVRDGVHAILATEVMSTDKAENGDTGIIAELEDIAGDDKKKGDLDDRINDLKEYANNPSWGTPGKDRSADGKKNELATIITELKENVDDDKGNLSSDQKERIQKVIDRLESMKDATQQLDKINDSMLGKAAKRVVDYKQSQKGLTKIGIMALATVVAIAVTIGTGGAGIGLSAGLMACAGAVATGAAAGGATAFGATLLDDTTGGSHSKGEYFLNTVEGGVTGAFVGAGNIAGRGAATMVEARLASTAATTGTTAATTAAADATATGVSRLTGTAIARSSANMAAQGGMLGLSSGPNASIDTWAHGGSLGEGLVNGAEAGTKGAVIGTVSGAVIGGVTPIASSGMGRVTSRFGSSAEGSAAAGSTTAATPQAAGGRITQFGERISNRAPSTGAVVQRVGRSVDTAFNRSSMSIRSLRNNLTEAATNNGATLTDDQVAQLTNNVRRGMTPREIHNYVDDWAAANGVTDASNLHAAVDSTGGVIRGGLSNARGRLQTVRMRITSTGDIPLTNPAQFRTEFTDLLRSNGVTDDALNSYTSMNNRQLLEEAVTWANNSDDPLFTAQMRDLLQQQGVTLDDTAVGLRTAMREPLETRLNRLENPNRAVRSLRRVPSREAAAQNRIANLRSQIDEINNLSEQDLINRATSTGAHDDLLTTYGEQQLTPDFNAMPTQSRLSRFLDGRGNTAAPLPGSTTPTTPASTTVSGPAPATPATTSAASAPTTPAATTVSSAAPATPATTPAASAPTTPAATTVSSAAPATPATTPAASAPTTPAATTVPSAAPATPATTPAAITAPGPAPTTSGNLIARVRAGAGRTVNRGRTAFSGATERFRPTASTPAVTPTPIPTIDDVVAEAGSRFPADSLRVNLEDLPHGLVPADDIQAMLNVADANNFTGLRTFIEAHAPGVPAAPAITTPIATTAAPTVSTTPAATTPAATTPSTTTMSMHPGGGAATGTSSVSGTAPTTPTVPAATPTPASTTVSTSTTAPASPTSFRQAVRNWFRRSPSTPTAPAAGSTSAAGGRMSRYWDAMKSNVKTTVNTPGFKGTVWTDVGTEYKMRHTTFPSMADAGYDRPYDIYENPDFDRNDYDDEPIHFDLNS